MSMKEDEVSGPIPKPYGSCSKCKKSKGDCGEHSMDFAWRGLVAILQDKKTHFENDRDYWKAKYEDLNRRTSEKD